MNNAFQDTNQPFKKNDIIGMALCKYSGMIVTSDTIKVRVL